MQATYQQPSLVYYSCLKLCTYIGIPEKLQTSNQV